ncbi:MAG TPA: hypothetical protein DCY07_01820 [Rhodospirillaceae bacterium]|nr:hypothetical protein [Rhodospirillaceae bacterium]
MRAIPINMAVSGAFSLFPKIPISDDTLRVEITMMPSTHKNESAIVWHRLWGRNNGIGPSSAGRRRPSRDVPSRLRNRNKDRSNNNN